MFLNLRMPDGTTHGLEALEGWRVMEVIRDWGLPIKAECGGAFNVDERSRLCCQIIMSKELDGLEVELAPESLADAPAERVAVGG